MTPFKLNYTHLTINENKLIPYDAKLEQRHLKLELIDLYDGKLNVFGDQRTAFSSTWLSRCKDDDFTAIKNAMYGYVRNVIKAKSGDVLWTTKKAHKGNLSGKGYTKGFISLNIRATNDYSTRSTMMYMYNRFMIPIEKAFFQDNGIKVNEDLLAVSDLLQWIWRSQIRNDEPISIYIASSRMRNLLLDWANYNSEVTTIKNLQLDYYKANPRKADAIILAVEYPQMTVQERAKRIGVHRSTLCRWTRETTYQRDYIRLTEHRNYRLRRTKAIV